MILSLPRIKLNYEETDTDGANGILRNAAIAVPFKYPADI